MNLETKFDIVLNILNTFLQAVIDARSLLAELNNFSKVHKTKFQSNLSMTSLSPGANASLRKDLAIATSQWATLIKKFYNFILAPS
jgi:hypothetical protein